jgi:hypothetical protein
MWGLKQFVQRPVLRGRDGGNSWGPQSRRPRGRTPIWRRGLEELESRMLLTVFIVNSTGDDPDLYLQDNVADTGFNPNGNPPTNYNGVVTLRAAIMQANFNGGSNTILFNLGSGPQTILTDGLPPITSPITVDGTSQGGYAGTPLIEIRGTGNAFDGLAVQSGSVIKGLVLNGFQISAIRLSGDGNTVTNCFIGTDYTGEQAGGNGDGIAISGGSNNTIGGTVSNDRNVIANSVYLGVDVEGGGSGNKIIGNYVGTDATGEIAMGNGQTAPDGTRSGIGIFGGSHNIIGGTTPEERNIVADSGNQGIQIQDSSFNEIRGNYVGTDVTGTKALGNWQDGVHIHGGTGNVIGVNDAGDGANLISGNLLNGVRIHGDGTTLNYVQGNIIGLDINGKPLSNQANGVDIESRLENGVYESVTNNVIGGTGDFDRNLISGNVKDGVLITGKGATGNTVIFNYIGTDTTGDHIVQNGIALGNQINGVEINGAPGNTIGGDRTAPRQLGNFISGNGVNGVYITGTDATGNFVKGNNIGSDPLGKTALGNIGDGVQIKNGPTGNTIGGNLDSSLTAGNVIVSNARGVVILDSIGGATDSNFVQGNYIGVARDGTTKLGNLGVGVYVEGSGNNTIGGLIKGNLLAPATGNVISGNRESGVYITGIHATGNKVQGNLIGIDAVGQTSMGNGQWGVAIFSGAVGNDVGGDTVGVGNVIVANELAGVAIETLPGIVGVSGNFVQGNYIGTDADSTTGLGNKGSGVLLKDADGNTIGGTTAESRNIISGNSGDGISITGDRSTGNTIEGDYIGTNVDGDAALANGENGVEITGASGNTIGGTDPGAKNVISGNVSEGILITGDIDQATIIEGNYIGTNADGTEKLGNDTGIKVEVDTASNNVIGGTEDGERNLISGNLSDGILVQGKNAVSTGIIVIQGNYIGTDAAGTGDLGNGRNGVDISNLANCTIGADAGVLDNDVTAGNTIAFNAKDGVLIDDSTTVGTSLGNRISRNSIFLNGGLGIELANNAPADNKFLVCNDYLDLDPGANNLQNYPEVVKLVRTGGSVNLGVFLQSAPDTTYTIEFYSNTPSGQTGVCESKTFIQDLTVTTDDSGKVTQNLVLPLADGDFLTMTATDPDGNTSEISQDRDGDGLFDSWEKNGVDVNNDGTADLSLADLGAKVDHKDVFVEADFMEGHRPLDAAITDVVNAFAGSPVHNPDGHDGINLHAALSAAPIPLVDKIAFSDGSFDTIKQDSFGDPGDSPEKIRAKHLVYRYCVFANLQIDVLKNGQFQEDHDSGVTRAIGASDFLVSLGSMTPERFTELGGEEQVEAGTFMHELGHSLGLLHGGGDDMQYKPNYLSVMNYAYQFAGNDPSRPLDYSRAALPSLDEAHLQEPFGVVGPVGRVVIYGVNGQMRKAFTNMPIDWNGNGTPIDLNVSADINFILRPNSLVGDGIHVLNGYDDWSNLQYSFHSKRGFTNGDDLTSVDPETVETVSLDDAVAAAETLDYDGDGIANAFDNAPSTFNPDQAAHNGVPDVIAKKTVTFQDQDGDAVTVSLTGAGTFGLVINNPDVNHRGSIQAITLLNTDATSTLTIKVKAAKTGNGLVDVGSITGTGLKALVAPAANLTGGGITLTGYLGALTLHDISAPAVVVAGGTAAQVSTVTVHNVADGTALQLGSAIKKLIAAHIGNTTIVVPSLAALAVTGDAKAHITGDFAGSITLSGAGVAAGKPALGSVTVAGAITGGTWTITGGSGAVIATSIATSWIATFTGALTSIKTKGDASGQITAASLGTLTVGHDLTQAAIVLTQAVSIAKLALLDLGTVKITGAVRGTTIRSAGNVGKVTAAGMFDSNLFAGVLDDLARGHTGLAVGRNDSNPVADNLLPSIAAVTIGGLAGQAISFSHSDIVAWRLGAIALKDVLTDTPNSIVPFGISADILKSYSRKAGKATVYTWPNKISPAWPADNHDDFVTRHVT